MKIVKTVNDMDKIEKIRQEIERRKNICEGVFERESDTYYQGKAVAYGELLTFLSTLESEEPDKSLEEETKRWWKEHLHLNPQNQLWMDAHQSVIFARHFYELGKNSVPLPEDTVLFNKGIEEGKRLMMEEAVEGEYGYFSNASKTILPSGKLNIKEGKKARIIVLPMEDEK